MVRQTAGPPALPPFLSDPSYPMTSSRLALAGVAFASFLFISATGAFAWPTWRGASGQGVALGAQPPTTWSDQQNIKWKAKIPGYGFSTPIIWKDRIYLLSAIETSEETG